jgi:hypothetical protein
MNLKLSAPRGSGLVCSGDRLMISASELQESPETVEEEPERAERRSAKGEVQEGVRRSRWQRLFRNHSLLMRQARCSV